MIRKQPHRSKRRLLPEFGKIDAQTKDSKQVNCPLANVGSA
jgi:hypothetical protein